MHDGPNDVSRELLEHPPIKADREGELVLQSNEGNESITIHVEEVVFEANNIIRYNYKRWPDI